MFGLFEVESFSVEFLFEMVVGLFEAFDLAVEFLILKLEVSDLSAHSHDDNLSGFLDNFWEDFLDSIVDMDAGGSIIEHGGEQLIFLDAIKDGENAIVEGLVFEFKHRVHGLYLFLVGRLELLSDLGFHLAPWSSLHNSLIQIL